VIEGHLDFSTETDCRSLGQGQMITVQAGVATQRTGAPGVRFPAHADGSGSAPGEASTQQSDAALRGRGGKSKLE